MRIELIATVTILTLGLTMAFAPNPAVAGSGQTAKPACCEQHRHGAPQQRHGARLEMPMYDPETEETFEAEILEVERMSHENSDRVGIHLRVRFAEGEAMVHLGPESFLEERGLTPEVGMTLRITGSWVDHGDERIVLPRTLVHADRTIELRDADGRPHWAGGPQGRCCRPARR